MSILMYVFFFKQKTAYEMRISDWSSDVCSSDLKNIERMRTDQEAFKNAYHGEMPATLFVLLPVFALMLKVAYIFKRRLYMEHLLVALHSHEFLCLTLLLVFLTRSEDHASALQ